MLFLNHIPLVIENYRRTLRFSGMKLTDSTTIFKTHPRAPGKETAFPANVNCIILQARFYTTVGRRITSSKRRMSGGSLTSWGYTSIWFLVQGKATHCGCCYYSIILSGSYIFCSRGDWQFKLIVFVDSLQKKVRYTPRSDFHLSVDRLVYFFG